MNAQAKNTSEDLASMDSTNPGKAGKAKGAPDLQALSHGNVQAVMASNALLCENLKKIGDENLAAGWLAIDTLMTDCRELTSIRSLQQLFGLQAKILARSLDSSVKYGSTLARLAMTIGPEIAAPLHSRMKANLHSVTGAVL